jgi:hypothetical protein
VVGGKIFGKDLIHMYLTKIKEFLDTLGWLNEYTLFETSPFGKCEGIKLVLENRVMAIYNAEPMPYAEFWMEDGRKEIMGYLTEEEFIAFTTIVILGEK